MVLGILRPSLEAMGEATRAEESKGLTLLNMYHGSKRQTYNPPIFWLFICYLISVSFQFQYIVSGLDFTAMYSLFYHKKSCLSYINDI